MAVTTRAHCIIIWVTEAGGLITQNMKHIDKTPITTEQNICKQIEKAAGCLEDIFLQAISVEHSRVPKTLTAVTKTHSNHGKVIINTEGEKV